MLDINRLNIVRKKVVRMVKAAKYIDETALSPAAIYMLVSSVQTLNLLVLDFIRSSRRSLKEDGGADSETESTFAESFEEIDDGLDSLVKFVHRLTGEMLRRVSRLK